MEGQFFRFKKRDLYAIFTCVSGGLYYKYQDIINDLFFPKIHPTKEYAEMLIKLDNRITNFAGYNYDIDNFKIIENTEKYQSYRMNLKGIRGICKVLVKVQKLDHVELKFLNDQQKKISLMQYDQRKKEPFVPIDFTDILIPTEKTLNDLNKRIENIKNKYKIQNSLPSEEKNDSSSENFLDLKFLIKPSKQDKSLEDQFILFDKLNNLKNEGNKEILKDYIEAIKIKDDDTFYRFMNISVSYSDNAVFNIRPLNTKFRDYELIDTVYTDQTYLDIFKKMNKYKYLFDFKNRYEVSAEELKNELQTSRHNYFREKLDNRSTFFKLQIIFIVMMIFYYKIYMQNVNYKRIYNGVVENLSKNKTLRDKLGSNFYIPYVSFSYNIFKKNFKFKCIAFSGEKKILVKGISLPKADNILPTLNFSDINNKIQI